MAVLSFENTIEEGASKKKKRKKAQLLLVTEGEKIMDVYLKGDLKIIHFDFAMHRENPGEFSEAVGAKIQKGYHHVNEYLSD
jgi:acyl dehydratase